MVKFSDKLNDLFRRCQWEKARQLLENEREKDPENHWVLTQLGVTFYEQKRYNEALQPFLTSYRIVADCPLTLWNLAGTLDALGKHKDAVKIYTWLLQTKRSPQDDPCWESKEWADALKTDTLFRLGCCFQSLGKRKKAEDCYRRYLNLVLIGGDGTYSVEEVTSRIRSLYNGRNASAGGEVQKAVKSAIQLSGSKLRKGQRIAPPRFGKNEILVGQRAASKK
jgi:hypothetical protein